MNPARSFELSAPGGNAHGFAHLLEIEIVEQDEFRTRVQRFFQFLQILHFNLN